MYASVIEAIAKCSNPNVKEALRLLEEAKVHGLADTFIYNSTLNAIAKDREPNVKGGTETIRRDEARDLSMSLLTTLLLMQ